MAAGISRDVIFLNVSINGFLYAFASGLGLNLPKHQTSPQNVIYPTQQGKGKFN